MRLHLTAAFTLVAATAPGFGLMADEVSFRATDGSTVYADEHIAPAGKEAPLLILFHQARASGRAEYEYALPRFQKAGYSILVVDQRSGGELFGGANRTVNAHGGSTGYCAAYADLEAAVNYAELQGYDGPVFAAGSSYSAGLVVRLGAEYTNMLNGVIAFSPASGGPMKDCSPNGFAATTKTPTMIVRPAREMEVPSAKQQYDLFAMEGHTMFVHDTGVHGSSTLDPSRTKSDTESAWAAVLAFLAENQ